MGKEQDILDDGLETEISAEQAAQYEIKLKAYRWQVRLGRIALGLMVTIFVIKAISIFLQTEETLIPPSYNWIYLKAILPEGLLSLACFIISFRYPRIAFVVMFALFLYTMTILFSGYALPNNGLLYTILLGYFFSLLIGIRGAFKRHPILKKLKSSNLKDF